MTQTRGIRNNNPLNIRRSADRWLGMRSVQTDPQFCQFTSMDYGCRAACRLLKTYNTKYKCRTLYDIIRRWAPPSENNTDTYVKRVCKLTGYSPYQVISYRDKSYTCFLLWAMAQIECGEVVAMQHFENGYGLAFGRNSEALSDV